MELTPYLPLENLGVGPWKREICKSLVHQFRRLKVRPRMAPWEACTRMITDRIDEMVDRVLGALQYQNGDNDEWSKTSNCQGL